MTEGERNIVVNMRANYEDSLNLYTDDQILRAHKLWSTSEDYPRRDLFLNWLDD